MEATILLLIIFFYNQTTGWAIQTSPGSDNYFISNNTFADPNPYIDGQIVLWGENINITIQNNIFYEPRNSAINCMFYGSASSGLTIRNNLTSLDTTMVNSVSCSSWHQSKLTMYGNREGYDPLFNTGARVYTLRAGSPAIDRGFTTYAPAVDIAGQARAGSPDIGAYEYTGSTNPTDTTSPAPPSGVSVQ